MIQSAFIIAMVCQFINATTWPKMIFHFPRNILSIIIPNFVMKTLCDCTICMVPYYYLVLYLIFPSQLPGHWALVILIAGGINTVISKLKRLVKS